MVLELIDLTNEILHLIFQRVAVTDLASISRCSKMFYSLINHDFLLWKIHYLALFDSSILAEKSEEIFWKNKLHKLIQVQKVLESKDAKLKDESLTLVATTALELLEDSSSESSLSKSASWLNHLFEIPGNTSHFMCRSSLFTRAGFNNVHPASTQIERQLSAKLHSYYGMSVEPPDSDIEEDHAKAIHPYARSRVYDLRRYNELNFWGPFLDDKSQGVDWEKVQAIIIVLSYNLEELHKRTDGQFSLEWDKPFVGLAQDSLASRLSGSSKIPRTLSTDAEDPYGITGTWMRIVCFLDYNQLYSFNFEQDRLPADQDQERGPIETEEAIRLIFLKLRVSRIEAPGEGDDPEKPVVHFTGSSKSMHMSWDPNANSKIRGTVRTTMAGAIRWTSFSIYHGEERWRSEGVQVGASCSSRGVVGTWFHKDYDHYGPAGPSAFWKLSNDIVEEKPFQGLPFPFAVFA